MITHQGRQYTDDGRLRVIHRSAPPNTLLKQGGWAIDSGGRVFIRVMPEIPANYGGRENMFGFKMDPNGCLLVATSGTVAYKHQGFAFRTDGAVFITTNTPVTKHQGLGRDSRGYLCVDGLAAAWNFVDGGLTGLGGTVAFTRGSTATYFGSDGLLKTAAIDAPRFDYDPSTASINILKNSEDIDGAAWIAQDSVNVTLGLNVIANPYGGVNADRVTTLSGDARIQQNTTNTYGQTVTASWHIKKTSGKLEYGRLLVNFSSVASKACYIVFNENTGEITATSNVDNYGVQPIGDWYRIWLTATDSVTAGNAFCSFSWYPGFNLDGTTTSNLQAGAVSHVWGAQLEVGDKVGPYVPTTSSIAGKGATPKGLLIEEARTNLLLQSENFSDGVWSKSNSSITENAIIAPDGATTADYLVENTASSIHSIQQTKSLAAGSYSYSVFAKAGARSKMQLLALLGSDFVFTLFDLNSGTASNGTSSLGALVLNSSSIENKGNGWYRCSVSFTSSVSSGAIAVRQDMHNGTSATYSGDGSSGCYFWGAQLEAASFPSSYIPTTTATVTRSADVATVTDVSGFYNAAAGSLLAEASIDVIGGSLNRTFACINDGTTNDRITVTSRSTGAARTQVLSGGATQVDMDNNSALLSSKVAVAYAVNDFAISANGVAPTLDTSGGLPVVNKMLIGSTPNTGSYINGHIRSISYYNKRLDNADLVAITT